MPYGLEHGIDVVAAAHKVDVSAAQAHSDPHTAAAAEAAVVPVSAFVPPDNPEHKS